MDQPADHFREGARPKQNKGIQAASKGMRDIVDSAIAARTEKDAVYPSEVHELIDCFAAELKIIATEPATIEALGNGDYRGLLAQATLNAFYDGDPQARSVYLSLALRCGCPDAVFQLHRAQLTETHPDFDFNVILERVDALLVFFIRIT